MQVYKLKPPSTRGYNVLTMRHELRDGPDGRVSGEGSLESNYVRMPEKTANSDLARDTFDILHTFSDKGGVSRIRI